MGFHVISIIRSIFTRRENRVIIPVLVIILIILLYTLYSVILTIPSQPQLSAYSNSWGDLSECRASIKGKGYDVSSIISSPTILSKIEDEKYKDMLYMAVGVERPYTEEEADELMRFIRFGGSLIIADDFGHGNTFWDKSREPVLGEVRFEKSPVVRP
jgi:hypothetical protein